jgi:hypothetical protein
MGSVEFTTESLSGGVEDDSPLASSLVYAS